MTTLVKALSDVAAQLGLDAGQLIGYAAEDTLNHLLIFMTEVHADFP